MAQDIGMRGYNIYHVDLKGLQVQVDSRIRLAETEDIPRLKEITLSSFTNSRYEPRIYAEGIENSVNDPKHIVLVYNGGSVQGYVDLIEQDINLIAVAESARGQGIAKKLMDAAIDILQKRGFEYLSAETEADNAASNQMYQKMNGQIVKTLSKPMMKP